MLIAGVTDGGTESSGQDEVEAALRGPDPAQRCVDLWNTAEGNTGKAIESTREVLGMAYVSVGFNSTFPDRCLITIARPESDSAQQYTEASEVGSAVGGAFGFGASGTASALDESVTQWNATLDAEGNLALGAPGSGDASTGAAAQPSDQAYDCGVVTVEGQDVGLQVDGYYGADEAQCGSATDAVQALARGEEPEGYICESDDLFGANCYVGDNGLRTYRP
jgi:hypothetical protein